MVQLNSLIHDKQVVLASSSPRRIEILKRLFRNLSVIPSTFPENLDKAQSNSPAEYVIRNAFEKGKDVCRKMSSHEDHLVISADTVVVYQNRILEKPSSKEHAKQMLLELSGRTHSVMTGVALFKPVTDWAAW